MSNIVEFVVKMRDMMSGGLGRLSSTSQSTFTRMNTQIGNITGRNKVLGQSFNELQKRIQDTENVIKNSTIPSQIRSARRELEALQRQAAIHQGNINGTQNAGGGGAGLGSIIKGNMIADMAMRAGGAIIDVVGSGIGGAISGSMKKETDIAGLATFLGQDGAKEAYKNIQKDAEITSFGTDSLLAVNRSLISAGLSAQHAREDAMNLANAIAATGGGNDELARMAANMQQIKTVGKATATDIKQFGMAGINIYEMLARSTGKSIDQVKEMDVSYDELAKALAMARAEGGIYAGALEAQSQTKAGKWATMIDVGRNALITIGDAFDGIIHKVLDVGIKFVESIAPMLTKMQPYIDMLAVGLGLAIDYVLGLTDNTALWGDWIAIASNLVSIVWGYLKNVFSTVGQIVVGIIGWIAKSEIIKDIFRAVLWILGQVFDVVGWIGEKLLWVWENTLKPILEGIDQAYKMVKDWAMGEDGKSITINTDINPPNPDDIPQVPTMPSYQADLTRFKSGGGGTIGDVEKTKSKNRVSERKAGDTISGGGPKTVNIHLGKFFDTIQFTTMNGNESSQELEKIVMECLGRVLYNGAKIV